MVLPCIQGAAVSSYKDRQAGVRPEPPDRTDHSVLTVLV